MNKPIHYATKKLKAFRDSKGWSQDDLAKFLSLQLGRSISRSTIQKWEDRDRGVNAETALDVAKCLGIPVNELVTQKDGAHRN